MVQRRYAAPSARVPVADSTLFRPDWTKGVPRRSDMLWLDKNENTDPELVGLAARIMSEISPHAFRTYPECTPLYRKLGASLGVEADRLVLTAGSDGAIRSVFEAFLNPDDVVVHTSPTFAMYSVYSRMYGTQVVPVEYERSERGPVLPVERILDTVAKARPKLVCLPNPDSPTGTVFGADELRRIIEAAGESKALILIDEAYYPFYEHSVLPWIDEYPHLVETRTFAKAWGLAGLRIGYAAACPEIARLLHKVRPMYEVNTVAVAMVERMLDFGDEILASVRRLNAGREAFLAAMEELGLRTFHARGNFLHVAFGPYAPAVHASLEDLVLYRRDFSEPCLKGFSRFSATTVELFQPVVERIRHVLSGDNVR